MQMQKAEIMLFNRKSQDVQQEIPIDPEVEAHWANVPPAGAPHQPQRPATTQTIPTQATRVPEKGDRPVPPTQPKLAKKKTPKPQGDPAIEEFLDKFREEFIPAIAARPLSAGIALSLITSLTLLQFQGKAPQLYSWYWVGACVVALVLGFYSGTIRHPRQAIAAYEWAIAIAATPALPFVLSLFVK